MNEQEYLALVAKLGPEVADKIKSAMKPYEDAVKTLSQSTVTKEQLQQAEAAFKEAIETVKEIAKSQGTTITELQNRLNSNGGTDARKTIAQKLHADKDQLANIYRSHSGVKEYMISFDGKKWAMEDFDSLKAAGPHATVNDVGTAGNVASVAQNFSAATLLRMASDAPIFSTYRNTPWIFDLVNVQNVGFDQRFFTWFDEVAKQGSSATVLEGATKPQVQYSYALRSTGYLKEAMLVSFTQEFDLDFGRLEDDIIAKSRVDLVNRMNTAILGRVFTNAVAYNSGATYAPTGDKVEFANDWDVIAALAAQAETATYSNQANAAVVGTNKKYRMGTMKDTEGRWMMVPPILQGLALVSNPEFTNTNVMVGDFKQYNVALRGGIIVKVGYNGTDFAENKFSVVIEQFYFDYIPELRKPAIVKGPDFATVKAAISEAA